MADYKDIISGTLNNLVDKVKEVANGEKVRSIYEQGTSKAKSYGRIAKLSLELNGDNEELKRIYTEIGKLYYEQAEDAPEGFFAPLFAQAAELNERIAAKEAEIEELKAADETVEDVEVEIEVEVEEVPADPFEEVVSATVDTIEEPQEPQEPEEPQI